MTDLRRPTDGDGQTTLPTVDPGDDGAAGEASEGATGSPEPDGARRRGERVPVFRVGDVYYFRHYFEAEAVFEALEPYYDRRQYRFEVPAEDFRDLEPMLAGRGYDPVVADPEAYAVVVRKYRTHPENVFADSVLQVSTSEHNVFVMKDQDAVEAAVDDGAVPLAETPLRLRLRGPGVGPTTVSDLEGG